MKQELAQDRAWIEIDLHSLENNIKQIKRVISNQTKIMPVIKANAYGHGIIPVAKKLYEIGIRDFAVATLEEGMMLRENKIEGNILILGYTDFSNITLVKQYDLIQTMVSYDYAQKINQMQCRQNEKLKVHIKINTGMNRIGENYQNKEEILSMYQMEHINILGIYSHLCVSDGVTKEDQRFTKQQIQNFFSCVQQIKEAGYQPGKTHIQASYGILNYPDIMCDYVRPGIMMYGVYSNEPNHMGKKVDIKPVLSLKARVTSIREIQEGDTISYGRTFEAKKKMKIASVGIGYADGYPRNLSNQGGKVGINGKYAAILGRICMDQLIIDVTAIPEVKQGDIVTLIGEQEEITVHAIAKRTNTITNEILCRLGSRLPIIVKE